MSGIRPFALQIPGAELEDLRDRLRRTRWSDAETVGDWSQGIPLDYVRELCRYWESGYDWRRVESRLNGLGQFQAEIEGLDIHFLHCRSPHPGALPLVLTHGWPGSVIEFLEVIGPLTDPPDPADAFHVVCPSLPGYGFSTKPTEPGWGVERIARTWAQLMAMLGYERYGAQGGDWGSMVTLALSRVDTAHVAGVHTNMPLVSREDVAAAGEPNERERRALKAAAAYRRQGSGYARQQSTFPQTLGYGLVDSPAAQCAWIVDKFAWWSTGFQVPTDVFDRDALLDNVMLYWLPATGTSSARLYWESFRANDFEPVPVPAGVSLFPGEIVPASPRWLARRFPDLRHCGEPARGGHFAAFEVPDLFVSELRAFFRHVR